MLRGEPWTPGPCYAQLDEDWNIERQVDITASYGAVFDVALDRDSGDVFLIGEFGGTLRMPNLALLPGPYGDTLFLIRLSPEGEARWGRGFLGRGVFEARFDGGDILIYGLGRAPFTNFGGEAVVHGPFATRLGGDDGEHMWTWGVHDESDGARATVDAEGRIVALYTREVEVQPASEGSDDCLNDPVILPSCGQLAIYSHDRFLRVVTPEGDEVAHVTLATGPVGTAYTGLVAAAPDGSVVIAEQPPLEPEPTFPSGGFSQPPPPAPAPVTTLTKISL